MTLLAAESDKLAQPSIDMTGFQWFALHVRPQRERVVADHLTGKGYELFLPIQRLRKRWSDRFKELEVPLFPGYLFCRFNVLERLPILKTPWVIQVVGNRLSPIPVDEGELDAVRVLVGSGLPSKPWPFMEIGDRVRIESGPFDGLEGILVNFRGSHRLVISVRLLQRSVAVEIDSAIVKLLRPTRCSHVAKREFQPCVV